MLNGLCARLGIDFPLFAFSHCRDVVAEVSRNGGFGVLGAVLLSPEQLETELTWIDAHCGGRPYGLDLLLPQVGVGKSDIAPVDTGEVEAFVDDILVKYGVDTAGVDKSVAVATMESLSPDMAVQLLEVAFRHNVKLFANALGAPPADVVRRCKERGVLVAGLAGTAKHARRQVAAGVDIVVAVGYEAGGHTGEIGTMVLVPEICAAVEDKVPVLAAGGIVTGHQIVAAFALGAQGVWTGSVWLTTPEAETAPYNKELMLRASASDTTLSKFRTGKPSRQLRSAWHDEWEKAGSPKPLPMPLMGQVCDPALRRVDTLADSGHEGARKLSTYWVGQGVGLMSDARPVRQIMTQMFEDCASAIERVNQITAE